jgi:hypothetical protein
MAYYQYKNILFEYQEFEDCIWIINAKMTRPSTNPVFKIPAEIEGKPVTSFSNYGMYNVALYINGCKDIIIPSTIENMCDIKSPTSLNIYVDSLDYYFQISNHLHFGRNSKLYVNNTLITTLKLNPNIPCTIRGLEVDTIDCTDLINFTGIQFFECDINRIINTNNIKIIPTNFSIYTYWNTPLYLPNVVIIDSKSFALTNRSIILICPNLVFIESNIIYDISLSFVIHTVRIQTNTNPIIYFQKYQINVNDCYTSGNH